MRINQPGRLAIPASALLLGLLGLLGLAAGAAPAPPQAGRSASQGAVSNAVPAGPVAPKSVFVIPAGPQEGRDPFFPKSIRVYATAPTPTNAAPAPPMTVELKLNGISGSAEHRLAIINGKTFEQGEEGEVRVGAARLNIRVLEIKANTVIVQVGAQQQILRMRSGL